MAAIINARDVKITSETRTQAITLPPDYTFTGDVTGTLNGIDVQDIITAAFTPTGDDTVAILQNSGTVITVNSSTLFRMPGTGTGGVFIGGGGLIGKDPGGNTKFTINASTGLLVAEDAVIHGTLQAGTIISGTATVGGVDMSTIKSDASAGAAHALVNGQNPHNVSLDVISGDLDDIADGSNYLKTTASEKAGGDRAFKGLDTDGTYVKSITTQKLTAVGSNPSSGVVLDSNGLRMYNGGTQLVNIPKSGNPWFGGDIAGGANIQISGKAVFNGDVEAGGARYAVSVNSFANPRGGIYSVSNSDSAPGVYGRSVSFNGVGVRGDAIQHGIGVFGLSGNDSNPGVKAQNLNSSGYALEVVGNMKISSLALVTNLNADRVDGYHAISFVRSGVCNEGTNSSTYVVSDGALNIRTRGTLAGTTITKSDGNSVWIEAPASDRRLKKKFKKFNLGLDFINKLNTLTFEYKKKTRAGGLRLAGLTAQNALEAAGDNVDINTIVEMGEDEYYKLNYAALVIPLINAVQELTKELKQLKNNANT